MSAVEIGRFSELAMTCIPQEYPNKLNQLLSNERQLKTPQTLHPAFFGCYDWHSSVHGHWMLVKVLKEFPSLAGREAILSRLETSITPENIATELRYFKEESKSWERMYGWAWLLQLQTELMGWEQPEAQRMSAALRPLSDYLRDRYMTFLSVQVYPVRTGVHPNTAFGMSFAYDYAIASGDAAFAASLEQAALRYFGEDRNCPIGWEPSGEDFLSACLEEAALMSRVLKPGAFQKWFETFLPDLNNPDGLLPVDVSDRTDPKIVHLDGLNLSRAWNLLIIANALDSADYAQQLRNMADRHIDTSLPFVTDENYVGSHWLGSFAIYALTRTR
ncbi:MAG: DUF2891 domain-containing protein [Pseudomonadota bacterium]